MYILNYKIKIMYYKKFKTKKIIKNDIKINDIFFINLFIKKV